MATAIPASKGALLLMAVLGGGLPGCSGNALSPPDGGEMICTAIGCRDEFSATVTVDTTMVPTGTYTVTVTVDGAASSCTLQLPPSAELTNDPCSAGFSLTVGPAEMCTTTQSATVTSRQCQPIDGKFVEAIMIDGTPSSIEVQQAAAGTVIFDRAVAPAYQTNEPNGPGCGPICHQAGAAWTIP